MTADQARKLPKQSDVVVYGKVVQVTDRLGLVGGPYIHVQLKDLSEGAKSVVSTTIILNHNRVEVSGTRA